MKYLLLFFPVLSFAQEFKIYRAENVFEYKATKEVVVKDGMVYKWSLPETDTARFFHATDGEYEATITFRRKGSIPDPDPDPEDVQEIDNVEFTHKPAANLTNTLGPGWNSFNGMVSPTPNWTVNFKGRTCSFSATAGHELTQTFTGKRVEVFLEKSNNKGNVAFSIDDGKEEIVDTYSTLDTNIPGNNGSVSGWVKDVPSGTHVIKIRVLGTKRPASTAANILIDYLKVTK